MMDDDGHDDHDDMTMTGWWALLFPLLWESSSSSSNNNDHDEDDHDVNDEYRSISWRRQGQPHRHDGRILAKLRFPPIDDENDGNNSNDDDEDSSTTINTDLDDTASSSSSYQPSLVVTRIHHHVPRGLHHTNRIGQLASWTNPSLQLEYVYGLKFATVTWMIVPLALWTSCLLLLKWCCGCGSRPRQPSCAAGGHHLDMKRLSRQGISRRRRKRRILRAWRIQSTYLVVAIMIPVWSAIMMYLGYRPFETAVRDMQTLVDDIETLAYRGWSAVDGLESTRKALVHDNDFVRGILVMKREQSQRSQEVEARVGNNTTNTTNTNVTNDTPTSNSTTTTGSIFVDQWCPRAAYRPPDLQLLADAVSHVETQTMEMVDMYERYLNGGSNNNNNFHPTDTFRDVTDTTHYMNETLQWFLDHDWVIKLVVMVLNVVNGLLLMVVYVVSKNNIYHAPTRAYTTYILVPLLCVLAVVLLILTCVIGISTMINADFCAGGEAPGSPQGTLEDAILSAQYASLDRSRYNATGTYGVLWDAVDFYSNDCLTDNPLGVLYSFADKIDGAVLQANGLAEIVPKDGSGNNTDGAVLGLLNQACGADLSFLPNALYDLHLQLVHAQAHLHQLVDTVGCHRISPIFRRVSSGSVCVESPHGLAIMWATSFLVCILCFVLLSVRAALYNTIQKKKPRDKKPRRVVEKEFAEYKEYMGQFYEDTTGWVLDQPLPSPENLMAKKILWDFEDEIIRNPTMETETGSADDFEKDEDNHEMHDADNAGIIDGRPNALHVSKLWDDNSCGSSYDSEVSDDSQENVDDDASFDDEQSAVASFISETKSVAMHTVFSVQSTLKPLLQVVGLRKKVTARDYYDKSPDGFVQHDLEDDQSLEQKEFDFGPTKPKAKVRTGMIEEKSIADESMYLTTASLQQDPSTPGLHPPTSLLGELSSSHCDDEVSVSSTTPVPQKVARRRLGDISNEESSRERLWASSGPALGSNHDHHDEPSLSYKMPYHQQGDRDPRRPSILQVLMTPGSVISALTPDRPKKGFSFLARTNAEVERNEDNGMCGGDGLFHSMKQQRRPTSTVHAAKDEEDYGDYYQDDTSHLPSLFSSPSPAKTGHAATREELEMSPLLSPEKVDPSRQRRSQGRRKNTTTTKESPTPQTPSFHGPRSAPRVTRHVAATTDVPAAPQPPKKSARSYGRLRFVGGGEN